GVTEINYGRAGNYNYGLRITDGASANLITYGFISNNLYGGILIDGPATTSNTLSGCSLGYDSNDRHGVGNGNGIGLEISNGAHNNRIGPHTNINDVITIQG